MVDETETFGALLRRLRSQTGRTQTEQAELLCELMRDSLGSVTRSEVSRYERGKRIPRPRMSRYMALSFGVPEGELMRRADAARRSRAPGPSRTVGCPGLPNVGDDQEGRVERRQFMGGLLGLGLASEPWGRLAAAIGNSGPADAPIATVMGDRTAALFEAEEHTPASQLYTGLTSHLDHLSLLIGAGGPFRGDLLVSAGETAALAGWLAFDMGDLTVAKGFFQTATMASREVDHPPLEALVLAYMSYLVEDPRTARDLLRSAQAHVRAPGYATARAWVSAREAEEAAATGDRDGALRAIERAQAVYDYASPDTEQPWVRFFSRARLDSMTVATYARLDHRDLGDVSEAALRSLRPEDVKVRAVILGDVATAFVASGDLERGAAVAREAMTVTREAEATLGRQRLRALAAHLPTGPLIARQLRDELAHV